MKKKRTSWQVAERFLRTAKTFDQPIYLSIDPGSQGAIAFMCGPHVAVTDIPVIRLNVKRTKTLSEKEQAKTGKKTKVVDGMTTSFDFAGICRIFNLFKEVKSRVVVVLEEVPSSLGPGKRHAEIMLNRAWAIWPLFLHSRGYQVEHIKPSVWKMGIGLRSKSKTNNKNKEHSRKKAQALFPKAELSLVKHHDRAEALLMGEYVRRLRNAKG